MNLRLKDPTFTLFVIQRATGALLAILLLIHLATIIYAVQGGLSVAEIVARVRGQVYWIGFYSLFGLTAIIHAMIGLRKILIEWLPINTRIINVITTLYVFAATWLGFKAIAAIV